MPAADTLQARIEQILEIARFAPSVHNTQPWRVTTQAASVVITVDSTHRLRDGDPTGRETTISLGIFTEAICLALPTVGLQAKDVSFRADMCTITVATGPSDGNIEAINLLRQRCSDRSIYQPAKIPASLIAELQNTAMGPRSSIIVKTDRQLITAVAQLTSQGIQLALSSPGFRRELSEYLVIPGSGKKRGIATRSLYIAKPLEFLEPWLVKTGWQTSAEVKLEKRRWESASGIVFICSEGDMYHDWFEVGRNYLRVSLRIEKAALSQATSAAVVEASDFHEDVEKLLGTKLRIQAMIRIGKGRVVRYSSPRISAHELLATSN